MGIEELEKYVESLQPIDTWGCGIKRDRVWANKSSLLHFVDKIKEQMPTQPELVEVPEFVAEWYELHKRDLEMAIFDLHVDLYQKNLGGRTEFEKWASFSDNNPIEILIRMKDGYTVLKEPTWVVRTDTGFLSFVSYSYKSPYELETSLRRDDAIEFKEEHIAEHIAAIIGGEAVPVEEEE